MPGALHIISSKIPGHGPSDAGNLPCLGVYGRAMGMASRPPGDNKTLNLAKGFALTCSSERRSFLCKASSNNQRRNPRQNRQGFSQNRNRQNEDRGNPDQLEEPDYLSSKSGPLLSFSNSNKNQATASPGPREREIVELFRKVQAQLRERAAAKEEKKFEVSKGQNKGSETVDSLLKLLRKHSVEQGKKKVNGGSASGIEANFDHPEQVGNFDEDKGQSSFNPISNIKDRTQEDKTSSLSRPTSNFKRRSPVPRVRYEPIISSKEIAGSFSPFDSDERRRTTDFPSDPSKLKAKSDANLEIALVSDIDAELEHDTELESSFADPDVAGEVLEVDDETSVSQDVDNDEDDNDGDEDDEEKKPAIHNQNLDAMKLQDLRALAKARGIRRYSKLKKSELIGLLSEDA
ncbi:hypothetical protein V2J09_004933 [Rumex salicifolius]